METEPVQQRTTSPGAAIARSWAVVTDI